MNELIEFSLDTENAEKNYQLAKFYEEQGHTAPAHSYYLRGAERTENKDLAYQALIRASFCYKEQGSRDLTEKNLLENALNLIPDRPEAYYFLSLIHEKKEEWQNCYLYANLGLQYSDKKSIVPEYQGKHLLIFTKAVSAWWWGKGDESRNLFDFIYQHHWEDFDQLHKNCIKENLIRVGKPIVEKKKIFIDAGTHLFQGFEQILKLQKINNSWHCYCFEANPFTFEMSKQKYLKLIENGFNIQHFNNAISDKNEIVNINCAEADNWDDSLIGSSTSQASNILKCPPEYCSEKNIIYTDTKSIITINFSDFISNVCNKNDFVVVKLDIEGSEFDVLDKLIDDNTIDYIDEIYIEFHSHFFKNPMLYEEKIKTYKKLFEQKNIKFIQWY